MVKVTNVKSNIETPTEKIVKRNTFKGEVIDNLGRKIILKQPDALEEYDLMKCLGQDAESKMCLMIASTMLYIESIDNVPFEQPQSYREFRHALKNVGRSSSAILKKLAELGKIAGEDSENLEASAESELKK